MIAGMGVDCLELIVVTDTWDKGHGGSISISMARSIVKE